MMEVETPGSWQRLCSTTDVTDCLFLIVWYLYFTVYCYILSISNFFCSFKSDKQDNKQQPGTEKTIMSTRIFPEIDVKPTGLCINQLAYCTSIWRSRRSVTTTINTVGFAFMDFSPGAVYLCVMFLAGGKRTLFIVSEYPRWSAERRLRTSADIQVFRSSGDITWLYTHSYCLRRMLRTSEREMYDL